MRGADYVAAITADASDRSYRRAFQELALELTRPGDSVFDFGSGPGLDARYYAEHERRVCVYDVDPAMSQYLAEYCRDLIVAGAVSVYPGGYREFLCADAARGRFGLITANFAPLNLIDDLRELFGRFSTLAAPGAIVLASVLSPYYAGDARYGWWWHNAARLCARGRYAVHGARSLIWRRTVRDFAHQCGPHFQLAEVLPGNRTAARGPARWPLLALCRYMFLLFHRTPAAQPRATSRA